MLFPNTLVLVRGAGDLATGIITRLHLCGFPVIATEVPQPMAVRRTVAFAQAVYDGKHTVEDVTATRVETPAQAMALAQSGGVVVLPDPSDGVIGALRPTILVDARLLKRPDVTQIDQAPLVIGLGPGFTAGLNCHAAIETSRGHRLGRIYWEGATEADTGVPGDILGYRSERLLKSPAAGVFQADVDFGDHVDKGQVVGYVEENGNRHAVRAPISGVIRGLMHSGISVPRHVKIGDIDPRDDPSAIDTISDKSRAIGGAVLTAILTWMNAGAVPGPREE